MCKEYKWPRGKTEWELVFATGISYLLDLYNYVGVKLGVAGLGEHANAVKATVVAVELLGMFLSLVFILFVWVRRKIRFEPSLRQIFFFSSLTQLAVASGTPLLLESLKADPAPTIFLVLLWLLRLFWGFTLGAGIGSILAIVSDRFSRRKRSRTVALVLGTGMFGPILATGVHRIFPDSGIQAAIPLLALLPLWFVHRRQTIPDTRILIDRETSAVFRSRKFWEVFFWLMLGGISVQFCVNYQLANPEGFGYHFGDAGKPYRIAVYARYGGLIIGTFGLVWWSIRARSRAIPFRRAMIVGGLAVPLYCFLPAFFENSGENTLMAMLSATAFLLGLSNAVWALLLLQGMETHGRKIHFVTLFLLPIVYRLLAGLGMMVQGLLVDVPQQLGMPGYNGMLASLGTGNQQVATVALIGVSLMLIGWIASFFWENNFEGPHDFNAYGHNFQQDFPARVLDETTRDRLTRLGRASADDRKTLLEADANTFCEALARSLETRLRAVFDDWMYGFNLGLTDVRGKDLQFSSFRTADSPFRDLATVDRLQAERYQQVAQALILHDDSRASLTFFSVRQNLNGLVLANSDFHEEDYGTQGYRCFNLQRLLPDSCRNNPAAIRDFWKTAEATDLAACKARFFDLCGDVDPAIGPILALRALDGARYPQGQYFVYFITPVNMLQDERQQRAVLILTAAKALPVEKLHELTDLLNWILAQRALLLARDAEWRKIAEDQSHSMKTAFGRLHSDLDLVSRYLDADAEAPLSLLRSARGVVRQMSDTNTLTLSLMRGSADARESTVFRQEAVGLGALLRDVLDDLGLILHSLGIGREHAEVLRADCLPALARKLENPAFDRKVWVMPLALRIILTDLLSNALFHTHYRKPKIDIWLRDNPDDDTVGLYLANNQAMAPNFYYFIKNGRDEGGIAVARKAGLRSIKRLLQLPEFNRSARMWRLDVDACSLVESADEQTILSLHIPVSDFEP